VLGDKRLDSLVEKAMSGNLSLRSTWDRLAQARAMARKAQASEGPSLDLTGGASGSHSGSVTDVGSTTINRSLEFSLGFAAAYEIDLWGRLSSAKKAANLDIVTRELDVSAAAISLSCEVVVSWLKLVELRGRQTLLKEQATTNQDSLKVVTLRFRNGSVLWADVLQQKQALESVAGERAQVQAALSVEEHRLAVLLGETPGKFRAPQDRGLPELPPLPRTGLPAEWVNRRPDLKAAFLRIQAADHRVAAAVADRFPRVSIPLRAVISLDVYSLITGWVSSLSENIVAPLFDGGRRKAEEERAKAVAQERLHAYGQALLLAFQEVENALVLEAGQRDYITSLEKQLSLSKQAVERALDGYKKGSVDFTRFLSTRISHQKLQRSLLLARREALLIRVRLYRSLGGAWNLKQPGSRP
jgi:NodT family efflux transporter outer membrane factor (OMF) lipoprotein